MVSRFLRLRSGRSRVSWTATERANTFELSRSSSPDSALRTLAIQRNSEYSGPAQIHLGRTGLEHEPLLPPVRRRELDLAVQPAGTQPARAEKIVLSVKKICFVPPRVGRPKAHTPARGQRWVERVGAVRGHDDLDVGLLVEAVHLVQQLEQNTLHLAWSRRERIFYFPDLYLGCASREEERRGAGSRSAPVCASNRFVAMASISSMKMMAGEFSRASRKTSRTCSIQSPQDTNQKDTHRKTLETRLALEAPCAGLRRGTSARTRSQRPR